MISQMETRFSNHTKSSMKLAFLLPKLFNVDKPQNEMEDCYHFYKVILSNSTLEQAKGEFDVWYAMWIDIPADKRPIDAVSTISKCDADAFPIIHRMLQILCVQPVSTASAERSFSNLRRLKTWLRSTSTEDRLSGLALMAMNRDMICMDDSSEILNRFLAKKTRRVNIL